MDIETQMNCARYLVDVLPTRALRTDRRQFDFFVGNEKGRDGGARVGKALF